MRYWEDDEFDTDDDDFEIGEVCAHATSLFSHLARFGDARHGEFPAACIDLWIRLSRAATSTKSLARVSSPVLSRLLDRLQESPAKNPDRLTWLWEDEKPAVNFTPRLVASFLEAVAENSATASTRSSARRRTPPSTRSASNTVRTRPSSNASCRWRTLVASHPPL